jgi:hypothetical protein
LTVTLSAMHELLADLRQIGFDVSSLADLRRRQPYPEAIPILLRALRAADNDAVREDIVRTLSVPYAPSEVAQELVDVFRHSENFFLKWAAGNGLEILADETVAEDVFALAADRKHGRAREMLVVAMARFKQDVNRAGELMRFLLNDPDVQGHALLALRRLRYLPAESDVRGLLGHDKAWIRAEARKALRVFERQRLHKHPEVQ